MAGYQLGENKFDVGTYVTVPKYRRLGLGTKTWNAAMESMGPNCNVSLSAVHGRVPMYNKMGFGVITSKRDTFAGVPNRAALSGKLPEGVVIEELGQGRVDELRDYDYEISGVDRFDIVRRYLTTCMDSVLMARKDEQVVGYVATHEDQGHHFLAPLYSDNKEIATALMSRLLENVPANESIAIDMFRDNQDASELRKELGINSVIYFEGTLVFTHEKYASRIDKIYSTLAPGILVV